VRTLSTFASAPAPASAAAAAAAEQHRERVHAAAAPAFVLVDALFDRFQAARVVQDAFVLVAQHLVSQADALHRLGARLLFFRSVRLLHLDGVFALVGVVFQRELPVCLLDFFLLHLVVDAQHFVQVEVLVSLLF